MSYPFFIFIPYSIKETIKTLIFKITVICFADTGEEGLNALHNTLREHMYPRNFVDKYIVTKVRIE